MMAKVRSLEEDGYSLRRASKKGVTGMEEEVPKKGVANAERINIWQIASYNSSKSLVDIESLRQVAFTKEERDKIIFYIQRMIDEEEPMCHEFISPINMKDYPSYLDIVKFEMNISKLIVRLNKGFYRRKEVKIAHKKRIYFKINSRSKL